MADKNSTMTTKRFNWLRLWLIILPVLFILSLVNWLIIALAQWIGPDQVSALLLLSWLVTACYPVVGLAAIAAGWYFYWQNKAREAWLATAVPLVYIPVALCLAFAAFWQIT